MARRRGLARAAKASASACGGSHFVPDAPHRQLHRRKGSLRLLALLALSCQLHAGYLTPSDINTIRSHWADYTYAQNVVGVPAAALAAIHYRESGLGIGWYSKARRKHVRNLGGPFMLDPGGGDEFKARIREYERKVARLYGYRDGSRVSHDFRFACLVAAHELKTKNRGRGLADALWGYNGRMVPLHESSYVWNDPARGKKMTFVATGLRFEDGRPGVMVVYKELIALLNKRQHKPLGYAVMGGQ